MLMQSRRHPAMVNGSLVHTGVHQSGSHVDGLTELADLISGGAVLVLSGAGLSTESGIPDYRGPTGLARRARPMTFQEFTGSAAARRRYWARSHQGWRHVACAVPNAGHRAVAELERRGLLAGIITQNVDGLHLTAGARQVIELHGSLGRVVCLGCGQRSSREALDRRLRAANPRWSALVTQVNPDGDAAVADEQAERFAVADCESCGGVLKPDVVFFGENVPPPTVAECYALTERASAVLVLGSSLTVMSGYRFVRRAAKLAIPVAIINQGPTRGDALAQLILDAPLGYTLTALTARCGEPSSADHRRRP
jgi:NAD-dependent SIR2 family protein deacetylase